MLPVVDELIARWQLKELCDAAEVLKIDVKSINGRKVRVEAETTNVPLGGAAVPVLRSHLVFRDVSTGEELGAYDRYTIKGGVMARWTGFPESSHPWTMQKSVCDPEIDWPTLPHRYGFTLVN